jgi:hypothetical protein
LRQALRKSQYAGLDRDKFRRILRDNDLADVLVEEAEGLKGVSGFGSPMEFFQWLLDHADEIIALITKLIALFDAE